MYARGCKCGKRMLEDANDGTCLWCGYGDVVVPITRSRATRLPRDLGSIHREGRRLNPRYDNVIPLRWGQPQPERRAA